MSETKNQLLEFNNIIKLLLKHQCITLLKKFRCNFNLPNDVYIKECNNIVKQIDKLNIILNIKKYVKTPKKKLVIPLKNRCSARIFNYNNIITQKGDKLIYGSRCTREKLSNSKYCKQHNNHIPHGDYNDIATSYIKEHYIKEYKLYVKKEKPRYIIKFT